MKNCCLSETEAFLSTDGTSAGHMGHDDDDEENKPMTRQVLLDKIRQKKEVIGKLRCQPWSMSRKRRTLRLAQKYLEQHESKVSKTHLFKEDLKKRWHSTCRWADNIKIYLIPWEAKIKTIESHFGSVVSSYFTFLRWVIFINLVISLIVVSFVVIPEVLADAAADEGRRNRSETRKKIPESVREVADSFTVVWDYNGHLKYSPLFYGYYSSDKFVSPVNKYNIPLSYFIITLFIFGYSFFAILKKMAANARLSKMAGSKAEQYVFNWNVFTGWDYTIGNPDAASNTVMAIIIKLRESIAECKVTKVKQFRSLLFLARVFANVVIILMLAFSIYLTRISCQNWTPFQVPAIVSTITHVFPMIFDLIGKMEKYHPRTALRAHLTRVLVLYMLNYMTLIISLFDKINEIQGTNTEGEFERFARQLGGRNPVNGYILVSKKWKNNILSRNFNFQELVKLVTMDLIITIASILIIDFFRGLWIRYCSSWWCWDIETTFPEYGEFKVAENVLHIINNQGMVWLGLFFAPMLPVLNNVKMIVLLYIRAWACMTCNVPAREIFRASRSSNFYLWILLLWLLLCTVPVFWVFASKPPSTDCGPFAYQDRYYNVVTDVLEKHKTTKNIFEVLKGIASPGVVIPTLLLLLIIIYFLVSLVRGLREANNDLQQQLFHERTEEKKKIFELAGGGTKKKAEAFRSEKKKKVVSYLPTVEQKRREPWRVYSGVS
uniref:TMC domain-containing protein n=1 Tax=Syphacia muris TaxID=451379 RepID=A0A0N5AQL8_9BILA